MVKQHQNTAAPVDGAHDDGAWPDNPSPAEPGSRRGLRWRQLIALDAALHEHRQIRLLTPEARVLLHLHLAGPVPVSEAMRVAGTSDRGFYGVLARLKLAGLVATARDAKDQRIRRLALNPACRLSVGDAGKSPPPAPPVRPGARRARVGRLLSAAVLFLAPSPWLGVSTAWGQPKIDRAPPRAAAIATGRDSAGTAIGAPPAGEPSTIRSAAGSGPEPGRLYGPPAPKARHGRLGEVDWPKAPDSVPPALEEAIDIVTRNYPTAKSARAAVRAAASDVNAARWRRFPSFTGSVGYLNSSSSPEPQFVVSAPVWSGGRIGADIRRAKASEDASSAGYVETVQTLALTTVQTYFDIMRLTLREQLLAASIDEHRRLVGTIERRVKQEVSPLADLELARSRTAQVEQEYNLARAARQTALRIMVQLVADPGFALGPIPYFNPALDIASPEALENESAAYSPQLRRLDAQIDVARAEVDSRRASILPQLNAQYSYDDFFGHRIGAVIRAQGDGGLSQFSQVNSARQRVEAAIEDERSAEQQLRRDVATDRIEFEAAKDRAVISHTASETAVNVSESYMRQFIAGRRSWLDVMNALREAVSAQIGRSEAEVAAMAAVVRLELKSGRWRPAFDQTTARQSS
ncbi:MAG: TolC family protein [Novosphingobium sp.]